MYQLSDYVFFIIYDRKLVLWNYLRHEQYECTVDHIAFLLKYLHSGRVGSGEENLMSELIEVGILVDCGQAQAKWGLDLLSKIFHVGTSNLELTEGDTPESFIEKNMGESESKFAYYVDNDDIKPKVDYSLENLQENSELVKVLKQRVTSRDFDGQPLKTSEISSVLINAFGSMERDKGLYSEYGFMQIGDRKTSPTAGGICTTQAYLLAKNIDGLPRGAFKFIDKSYGLNYLGELPSDDELVGFMNNQFYIKDLSAIIIITARLDRLWNKYSHSRAYRMALIEAGHFSQTCLLLATSLNLLTWVSGAFADDAIANLICVDSDVEVPLMLVGIGSGEPSPLDKETKNF